MVPDANGVAVHSNWSHDGSTFTWEVLGNSDTASVWAANANGSEPTERAVCAASPCVEASFPSFSHADSHLLVTQFDRADNGDWGPSPPPSRPKPTPPRTFEPRARSCWSTRIPPPTMLPVGSSIRSCSLAIHGGTPLTTESCWPRGISTASNESRSRSYTPSPPTGHA